MTQPPRITFTAKLIVYEVHESLSFRCPEDDPRQIVGWWLKVAQRCQGGHKVEVWAAVGDEAPRKVFETPEQNRFFLSPLDQPI